VTHGHDPIHGIEDHGMLEHPVVVKFPDILHLSDAPLVELEIILLKAKEHGLCDSIDDLDNKVTVVPLQCAQQDCEKVYVAILDLSGLGEDLMENCNNLESS
jgi:hypothetical protein